MRIFLTRTLFLVALLSTAIPEARAALQRVGPVVQPHGYPAWYQDSTGLVLDFCTPTSQAELDGGWCLLLPAVPPATLPVAPEIFPTQFFDEHFYWAANASAPEGATRGDPGTALLTIAVEAAFASGPVIPGDQMTFGRLRIVIPRLKASGTYIVYHPFGKWVFPNLVAGDRLFYTEDIGVTCPPGTFDCALATTIGPFLLPSATPGGAELPPIPLLAPGQDPIQDALVAAGGATPYPGDPLTATPKYIADPARLGPVTGSPLPPFTSDADGLPHDHNTFRIEVLAPGATAPTLLDESQLFTLQGKVYEGAVPGRVTIDRVSYTNPVWASSTAAKVDVYATGIPAMQARIPPGARPQTGAAPALQFWDAPCVFDAVTGAPVGPPAAGAPHQLFSDPIVNPSSYWGQAPPPTAPASVCVAQTNAVDAAGRQVTVYFSKSVVDEVEVSSSLYEPATTALSVSATSSDIVNVPTLTLFDIGALTGGAWTSTGMPAPATVRVASSAGGVADFQTATGVGAAAAPVVPVAANDMVTMFEDCSATTASACATPLVIAPLANDQMAGAPIVFGTGVTVTLVAVPRLGTAVVNLDGTVTYTPFPNQFGTDGFAYTVSVTDANGVVTKSNVAGVSVVLTQVNDAPVAANDAATTVMNSLALTPATLPLTIALLANDTDVDGPADIVAVANLTQPVGPAGAAATAEIVPNTATVSFTADTAGTYTFTYQAQDAAGALSNVATVTVTVAPAEIVTVTGTANYRISQTRWTISGTASPAVNQLLKIQYFGGPNDGFVLGFAQVDALGNWLFDVRGVGGLYDPSVAQATQVWVLGPAGGSATAAISVR